MRNIFNKGNYKVNLQKIMIKNEKKSTNTVEKIQLKAQIDIYCGLSAFNK